jgi:hypothetical protein
VSWCFHEYEVTLFLYAFCGILSRSLSKLVRLDRLGNSVVVGLVIPDFMG